jgi:HEAT repeat protein
MSQTFKDTLEELATSAELHTAYLYTFSNLDQENLQIFQESWPTIPTARRRDIMQELVEICEANFEVCFDPVFLLGLGDDDAAVRASAINGLWENESTALIGPLVHLLRHDPAVPVRATSASALSKFIYLSEIEEIDQAETLLAEEALLETIHQQKEDIEVRRRAVEAIAYSGEAGVVDIIESAYYDESEKMQVSAVFAMGRNGDERWRSRVIAELDNPNHEIRFEAARACGELELQEAVPKLINLVEEDPDLEVQEMSIWAMGRIGGTLAREALEICLESEIESLALAAEEALDELNLFAGTFDLFDFDEDDFEDYFEYDDLNGNGRDHYDDE